MANESNDLVEMLRTLPESELERFRGCWVARPEPPQDYSVEERITFSGRTHLVVVELTGPTTLVNNLIRQLRAAGINSWVRND